MEDKKEPYTIDIWIDWIIRRFKNMGSEWLIAGGVFLFVMGAVFTLATARNGPILIGTASHSLEEARARDMLIGGFVCAVGVGIAVLGLFMPKSPGSNGGDG